MRRDRLVMMTALGAVEGSHDREARDLPRLGSLTIRNREDAVIQAKLFF
jgi:hypothetical protein